MDVTRIIAVRHGETAWNQGGRIQGHLDIPLHAAGHTQALQLADALASESVDRVYSSDLQRAVQTATPLAAALGLPIVTDAALRERCFGVFQGRTFAEIEAEDPALALRWRKRDPDFAPSGGESLVALRARITAAIERLAAGHQGGQIVVVTHGGVLDVLYRAATRLDLLAPRTWALGNAAINRLLWSPEGLTLVGWADVQHLVSGARDETSS